MLVAHGGEKVMLCVVAEMQVQDVHPSGHDHAQRTQHGVYLVHLGIEQVVGGDVAHSYEVANEQRQEISPREIAGSQPEGKAEPNCHRDEPLYPQKPSSLRVSDFL